MYERLPPLIVFVKFLNGLRPPLLFNWSMEDWCGREYNHLLLSRSLSHLASTKLVADDDA